MLKAAFYLGLGVCGAALALFSPLAGAIACFEAYLLNPAALAMEDFGFRYQFWITLAFFIGLMIHRPRGVEPVGREGIVLKGLWLYVLIAALSATWAVFSSTQALLGVYEVFKTVLFITYLLRVIRDERDVTLVMGACIIGIWHAAFMHVFGVRWGYVEPRFAREIGVLPDGQSSVLLLFTPTLLVLAMLGKGKERLLSWCALPFVLNSIITTYMRASFIALAAEGVLTLFFLPRRISLRLIPVIIAASCLFVFRLAPADYWDWMKTVESPTQEASAESRFVINGVSLQVLMDYPMGVGYDNYADVSPRYLPAQYLTNGRRSNHNTYLSVLCETGVFGFLAWAFAFGGTIWLLRGIRKTDDPRNPSRVTVYAMGLEIGLYGWMIQGLFHSDHEVDPVFWFVALAIILTRLHKRQETQPEEQVPPDSIECVHA